MTFKGLLLIVVGFILWAWLPPLTSAQISANLPKTPATIQPSLPSDDGANRQNLASLQRDVELLKNDLKSEDARLRNKIEIEDAKLETQDKLLNTFSAVGSIDASRFGVIATVLGVLVTGVVIFFAFKTSSNAIIEAKLEAEKVIKSYRGDFEALTLTARMLASDIKESKRQAEESARTHLADIGRIHGEVEKKSRSFRVLIEEAERS